LFFSPQGQGGNGALDSDANRTTGIAPTISPQRRRSQPRSRRGLCQTASLGDFVFLDVNCNGIQDTNEPGFAGVTVNLLDGTGKQINTR